MAFTLGLSLALWLLLFIYILLKLVFVSSFREILLSIILRVQPEDEREEALSGAAAKKGYFLTTALICILLFISVIKISLETPSVQDRQLGKKGSLNVGFSYSLISKEAIKNEKAEMSLKELPLSKEGILTLILFLQLASYHLYFRRKKG